MGIRVDWRFAGGETTRQEPCNTQQNKVD